MHSTDQEHPDTYPWRGAPLHLMTRRQLRKAGLRPNGQEPAALVIREATAHKPRRVWAYLYDTAKAAPKRVATAAQRAAIDKAIREHQARAAERRGISRDELNTINDPGPAWTTKENEVSTTTQAHTNEEQPQLGIATGHGQRITYLAALAAVNDARDSRTRIDAALERIDGDEEERRRFAIDTAATLDDLDHKLEHGPAPQNIQAWSQVLAETLTWRGDSEMAAATADGIITSWATDWGVLIDPDNGAVAIDPNFDAIAAQSDAETRTAAAREQAVVDTAAALPLPDLTRAAVHEAMWAWRAAGPDNPAGRQVKLCGDLAAIPMPTRERDSILFAYGYLLNLTEGDDLLDTPALIDPGEEARGRVAALLDGFAAGQIAAPEITRQISVMTEHDQAAVRDAGRALREGRHPEPVFPDWVDREQLGDAIADYLDDAIEMRATADYIAGVEGEERQRLGVSDDTAALIERMARSREQLQVTATAGKGLASMERHQITATLDDIDSGAIQTPDQLPSLMWVDERTKAEVDERRSSKAADSLAAQTKGEVTLLVEQAGTVAPRSKEGNQVSFAVSAIGEAVYTVGTGVRPIEDTRKLYVERRGGLDLVLDRAGIGTETRQGIRGVVDGYAAQAAGQGRVAADRRVKWQSRTDAIIAGRDDAAAQRRAAGAGRDPRPVRGCTTRTASPTPSQAMRSRRQLGVGDGLDR